MRGFMEYVVTINERGRIVLPSEVRRLLGIKGKSKVIIKVRSNGIIELIPFNKIYNEVARVFEEKFQGRKEEDQEASKLLFKLVK